MRLGGYDRAMLIILALALAAPQAVPGQTTPACQSQAKPAHMAAVRRIIEALAALKASPLPDDRKADAQARLFHALEALGPSAAPAIIAQMDDRRPLAVQEIRLVNRSAEAFEAFRIYGPELIVDALDAILNQLTGQYFSGIYNGGSEAERRQSVAGWRAYAAGLACRHNR